MSEIRVGRYRLHYREAGGGRPLFLIHGLAGASAFWTGTLAALPRGFRGIAPDLLGFGDSDKPRIDYSMEGHAARLVELASALELSAFDLLGHSMGGMIALCAVLAFPEKVRKLILINTPIRGGRALHGRGRLGATAAGIALVKAGLGLPFVLRFLRRLPRYYFVLDPRFTAEAGKAPFYSLLSHARALRRTDLSDRLRDVSAPTLVMGTDQDGIVRPSEFSLAAAAIPGAAGVWIRGAGHCPTLEKPEQSHGAIFDFLTA